MAQLARKGLLVAVAASGAFVAAAGVAGAESGAQGGAAGSPGVGSGNVVQAPVNVPVNVCGNSVSVVGALNPAFGNSCANTSVTPPKEQVTPSTPATPSTPKERTRPTDPEDASSRQTVPVAPAQERRAVTDPAPKDPAPSLAETGASTQVLAPLGLALVLGGAMLYRRVRTTRA
jgi:LPXTG-motif cell wall-anchored protein